MRIRTQLVAAFLLLAVVPLTSIVLFSYATSIRAVERAVEAEASQRTAEMDQHLKGIGRTVKRGVDGLSQVPLEALLHPEAAAPRDRVMLERLMTEIGDAAPYLGSLVVVPKPSPPPAPGEPAGEVPAAPELPLALAPSSDAAMPPVKIDFGRLRAAFERSRQEDGEVAEPADEGEDAMAELGLETAEIAMLGLSHALEALGHIGDEEAQKKIEEKLAREIERKAEKLGDRLEKVTEQARAEMLRRRAEGFLGQELGVEIRDRGAVVAEVHAEVERDVVLRRVLAATRYEPGEMPFVLDAEGRVTGQRDNQPALDSLELERDPETGRALARRRQNEWMIVSTAVPEYGLTVGVAHPIGESLAEIRRTTARNLAIGLGLVGLALTGVLPISKRVTRGLESVTEGAKRIAHGDLATRVPVTSRNEVGQLATAFNRMAEDLKTHQERLVEEEGRRKEQELEYQRKSRELEDARQFQLSLLPKSVPRHPSLDIAVDMRTAAEVGGDYYDFHLAGDGTLTLAVGDATGHGARAGTMVTVVKSLFSSTAADLPLADFLQQAARTIKRMDLGRMAMALTVARLHGDRLTVSAAGMPPALVYRAGSGKVEELALAGMPLGGLASDYEERSTELGKGDTLLLLSDGLPELPNGDGEPLGYAAVREAFAAAASRPPDEVIAALTAAASRWSRGGPPSDDMTFVVVKKK